MTHHPVLRIAIAAASAALFAGSALGDEPHPGERGPGAAGDWNCRVGDQAFGTLSVRGQSYVLNRFGTVMAGEYRQDADHVVVTSGPLVGMGVADGTLLADAPARVLEFLTGGGALLSCREVL